MPLAVVHAIALVKKAAALVNLELRNLNKERPSYCFGRGRNPGTAFTTRSFRSSFGKREVVRRRTQTSTRFSPTGPAKSWADGGRKASRSSKR